MTEPTPTPRLDADAIAAIIKAHLTMIEVLFRLPIVRTLYTHPEDAAWITLAVEGHPWLSAQNMTVHGHPFTPRGEVWVHYGTPPDVTDPDWHPDLLDAEANALYWNPGTLGGAV